MARSPRDALRMDKSNAPGTIRDSIFALERSRTVRRKWKSRYSKPKSATDRSGSVPHRRLVLCAPRRPNKRAKSPAPKRNPAPTSQRPSSRNLSDNGRRARFSELTSSPQIAGRKCPTISCNRSLICPREQCSTVSISFSNTFPPFSATDVNSSRAFCACVACRFLNFANRSI